MPRKKRLDPPHALTPSARLAADVAAMLALRAKASSLYKEAAAQEEELIGRMEHASLRTVELEGGALASPGGQLRHVQRGLESAQVSAQGNQDRLTSGL